MVAELSAVNLPASMRASDLATLSLHQRHPGVPPIGPHDGWGADVLLLWRVPTLEILLDGRLAHAWGLRTQAAFRIDYRIIGK